MISCKLAKILIFSFFTSITFAQEVIDTIHVNANQIPLSIRETGRNITVLTDKDIQSIPSSSIEDLLQAVQGIEIQSRGAFGTQADIVMRGSTFSQVLILIDGMRMNDPLTGHFNGYFPITSGEIERIEILRGAAAAMFGSDAVGGVINIISKTFSEAESDNNYQGHMNIGQHALLDGEQAFLLNKKNLKIGGGYTLKRSDGERIPKHNIDSLNSLESYFTYFDIQTLGFSMAYEISEQLSLKARTSFDNRNFNARYFYSNSIFDKSKEKVSNRRNHIQLKKTSGSGSSELNFAHSYNMDEFVFSPDFPSTNLHISQKFDLTLNQLYSLNENTIVKGGIQVDRRSIESNDRGNHEDNHYGAYIMGYYNQHSLNLSMSLRADYDENFKFEFSPQLNVSYVLPSIVFRAALGKSIRAADYTERYVSNNLQDLTPGRSLGNPFLKAEKSWSEEIGVDWKILSNWQLKSSVFSRQSSRLIDYILTAESEIKKMGDFGNLQEGADYYFAQNIHGVNTLGLEIESSFSYKTNKNTGYYWNTGYTFLNTSKDDDLESVYLTSHARHLLTSNFILTWSKLDVGISALYKIRNEQYSPAIMRTLNNSYDLWNIQISFELLEGLQLNCQILNLFNKEYYNVMGAKMPSRWVIGGLKWNLGGF